MSKLKYLNFFFILAFGLFLASCSDDDKTTNPTDTNDYLPTATGNYWIYQTYDFDKNMAIDESSRGIDSMLVSGQEQYSGKSASLFTTFSKLDQETKWDSETDYFAKENNCIFLYANFAKSLLDGFGLDLQDTIVKAVWVKLTDPSLSSWDIQTIQLPELEIPIQGVSIKIKLKFTLTGERGGTSQITVPSGTYTAKEYILNIAVSGTINDLLPITPFTFKMHNYFANNIGMIKSVMDPLTFSMPGADPTEIPGSARLLLRYKLVK